MHPPTKLKRRLLVAAALLALFLLTGFFLLPPVIRSQLEKQLSATLGRQVSVERVRLNPCVLSLTIENFTVRERDGTTPFLSWRRLYVDFDLLSSLWGEWVLSEVELDGLQVRGQINADRTFNVSDLIARFTPASPAPVASPAAKPPRPVRVPSRTAPASPTRAPTRARTAS